jgi:hypothetical protein
MPLNIKQRIASIRRNTAARLLKKVRSKSAELAIIRGQIEKKNEELKTIKSRISLDYVWAHRVGKGRAQKPRMRQYQSELKELVRKKNILEKQVNRNRRFANFAKTKKK